MEFSEDQKRYLEGFLSGTGIARSASGIASFSSLLQAAQRATVPPLAAGSSVAGPDAIHWQAQDRVLAEGQKLTPQEEAKRKQHPLDMWDEVVQKSLKAEFPKGDDVLAFKYHGLFFVGPAQDAYMCRLRMPGGILSSHQFRGIARIADAYGGGYADATTRANLQIREITAANAADFVTALQDLGILIRGSGADNIRNVTGSPTAGIDPQELIDTRSLTRAMHYYILHHREMYGLPRKFNIAFDGGGAVSALEDTNDIGFTAVRVAEGKSVPAGVYFRLALGGITGHRDFAQDEGVLLTPDQCVPVAAAVVRVFIEHGDRTDRKKARLKYLLDRWSHEQVVAEAEKLLPFRLMRLPLADCEPRPAVVKHGHLGVHSQKQRGKCYIGVLVPAGRVTSNQMRGLADLADLYGSSTIRMTVWQNLLISDVAEEQIPAVQAGLEAIGLHWSSTNIRGALVACTGNAGCKYAAANTKRHALEIADYLDSRIELDHPINIHLTGCPHSCAQHYLGDIGLLGIGIESGDDIVEGYHLYVGGGYGDDRHIAREVRRNIPATELPRVLEQSLNAYLASRTSPEETFNDFVRRLSTDELKACFEIPELVSV